MAKKIIRSDEKKSIFGLEVNGPVFFISLIFIVLSITLTLIFRQEAETAFQNIQKAVADNTDWFFILAINSILFFLIYLALGKYGKLRIGARMLNRSLKKVLGLPCFLALGWG